MSQMQKGPSEPLWAMNAADRTVEKTEMAGGSVLLASDQDLLLYMRDLLSELEDLAKRAKLESLADLLGYTQREVERNRKEK